MSNPARLCSGNKCVVCQFVVARAWVRRSILEMSSNHKDKENPFLYCLGENIHVCVILAELVEA